MDGILFAYLARYLAAVVCAPFSNEAVSANSVCYRILAGTLVTIDLFWITILTGSLLAMLVALIIRFAPRPFKWLAQTYVYVFRGTPLLVQLWIFYYGFGALNLSRDSLLWYIFSDAWRIACLTLILNTAAYSAEILRGGFNAIQPQQIKAATAYGFSRWQTITNIIMPQAVRFAWPAYGNEVILMLKSSALVSTITILDLMGQARTLFARSYDLTLYFYVAIIYLCFTLIVSFVWRRIEARIKIEI